MQMTNVGVDNGGRREVINTLEAGDEGWENSYQEETIKRWLEETTDHDHRYEDADALKENDLTGN